MKSKNIFSLFLVSIIGVLVSTPVLAESQFDNFRKTVAEGITVNDGKGNNATPDKKIEKNIQKILKDIKNGNTKNAEKKIAQLSDEEKYLLMEHCINMLDYNSLKTIIKNKWIPYDFVYTEDGQIKTPLLAAALNEDKEALDILYEKKTQVAGPTKKMLEELIKFHDYDEFNFTLDYLKIHKKLDFAAVPETNPYSVMGDDIVDLLNLSLSLKKENFVDKILAEYDKIDKPKFPVNELIKKYDFDFDYLYKKMENNYLAKALSDSAKCEYLDSVLYRMQFEKNDDNGKNRQKSLGLMGKILEQTTNEVISKNCDMFRLMFLPSQVTNVLINNTKIDPDELKASNVLGYETTLLGSIAVKLQEDNFKNKDEADKAMIVAKALVKKGSDINQKLYEESDVTVRDVFSNSYNKQAQSVVKIADDL